MNRNEWSEGWDDGWIYRNKNGELIDPLDVANSGLAGTISDIGESVYLGAKRAVKRTAHWFLPRDILGDSYAEFEKAVYNQYGREVKEEDRRIFNLLISIISKPEYIEFAVEVIIDDLIDSST
ncbi:hypothetical protein BB987_16220 [Photorhabdus temperata]|nr:MULTISPECIES: hypothetical protein [Photorhabdus]ETS29552.1 hypothetical protein PTE_03976 [Photorhabdus khanii NC19]NHB97926.1 hypothetical protein [Photorhabdus stackebrandtii]OHV51717.1 hypothetical protein BB987_16220 [Photorhabdus temperata]